MLIAASIAPHVCGQLLDAGRQEKIQIIISPQLLAELKLVLGREKFRRWLTEPEARHAAGAIARLGELHQDPPPQPGLTPDPKTTTSSPSRAPPPVDYLISGDQHLTGLHDPLPPVLTPRQLLDQLKDRPREGLAGLTVLAESAGGTSHHRLQPRQKRAAQTRRLLTTGRRDRRQTPAPRGGAGDKSPHPDPMNLPRRP